MAASGSNKPRSCGSPSSCHGCEERGVTATEDLEDVPRKFRSAEWFGREDKDGIYYRGWMKSQGIPNEAFDSRPVIGILNTWSELNPCNGNLRELAQKVRDGVLSAGGLPLEVPVMSLGESTYRPTAMHGRNLAAMVAEELMGASPLDGVVLLVGCDKTTPSLMMAAASKDLPTIVVSTGPTLNGKYNGKTVGSGTSLRMLHADFKCGKLSREDFLNAEGGMSRSQGTRNSMGTASTMACMAEALGMTLSGGAAVPAVDSRRKSFAHKCGQRIVGLVRENSRPSKFLTRPAFKNAVRVLAAIGGSTNAIIHLLAIAGRLKLDAPITLYDFDTWGRNVPTLVNLMPSGEHLMEEFFYAGGLPVVLKTLCEHGLVDGSLPCVSGLSLWDEVQQAENYDEAVIRPFGNPVMQNAGIAVLRGNLAPLGAVIKPSAASRRLLKHSGRAVVFRDIDAYRRGIDRDDLDVDEDSVLVLPACGPRGYPGMAEVGDMALPAKLLRRGVRDVLRVSDARMSGTAFGTVVLHVSPEAAVGGPLALVRTGDVVTLDVERRALDVRVSDEELRRRRAEWAEQDGMLRPPGSGYEKLYYDCVEGG